MRWRAKYLSVFDLSCACWNDSDSSKHWTKQISDFARHLIFHRLSPFNSCLGVVLQLGKGDYPENLPVVFCPNR